MKRLVLAGGGHANVQVLKAIAGRPDPGVSVTLVTPVATLLYSGMLPGFVAGHYVLEDCGIDLAALAARAGARVVGSAAALVNPSLREVICANGEVVPYDVLSIDVGSRTLVGDAIGVEKHAVVVRPIERFVLAWEDVLRRARLEGMNAVTVVGGGAGGIELAFAMDYRFRKALGANAPHVRVVTDAPAIVPEYPGAAHARLARLMRSRNIGMHASSRVAEVGAGYLRLRDNLEFTTDATFWVAGAAAHPFIRESGLRTDDRGFLLVNNFLQSLSHPEVFGAGDCATSLENPRPKAGVFAVRAGPSLAANVLALARGEPLREFVTRKRFLALVSCGNRYAVGVYGPVSFEGRWVWRWKDRIDRAFLDRYREGADAPA